MMKAEITTIAIIQSVIDSDDVVVQRVATVHLKAELTTNMYFLIEHIMLYALVTRERPSSQPFSVVILAANFSQVRYASWIHNQCNHLLCSARG